MTKKIKEDSNSIKILWISPNLVHYKIKNLSYLHQSTKIRLDDHFWTQGGKIRKRNQT